MAEELNRIEGIAGTKAKSGADRRKKGDDGRCALEAEIERILLCKAVFGVSVMTRT
jgi:hypothetical protein